MTRHAFRQALCCLRHIDRSDLVDAGIIEPADGASWQRFASNPERFFLRCGDEMVERLWGLIEGQMQPRAARKCEEADANAPRHECRCRACYQAREQMVDPMLISLACQRLSLTTTSPARDIVYRSLDLYLAGRVELASLYLHIVEALVENSDGMFKQLLDAARRYPVYFMGKES